MSLWKVHEVEGWNLDTDARVLIRDDGVRLSLFVDLLSEDLPRDEAGEPKSLHVEWLVQRPRAGGTATSSLPTTLSPVEAMQEVDQKWPMGWRE